MSSFLIGALAAAQTCSTSYSTTSCSFSSTPYILIINILSYCSSVSLSYEVLDDSCWIYRGYCSSLIVVIFWVGVFVIHVAMSSVKLVTYSLFPFS